MRSAIIGFVLGGVCVIVALVVFQRMVIKIAANDLDYRFQHYAFSDTKFPWGYLVQGRVISRCLYPVRIKVTFYDSAYHEVTEADKLGRYGAVVRIGLNGAVAYRYITLFRTPAKTYWTDGLMAISAQLPPGTGIDPIVLRNQAPKIGQMIKEGFSGDNDNAPEIAILLAGLYETQPGDPPAVNRTGVRARDEAWWAGLRKRLGLSETYPYFVELPHDYAADAGKKWQVILYLHSGLERGNNLQLVRDSGLPKAMAASRQIPAIVVAPQLGWDGDWSALKLADLLDQISAKYRVDPDRIYVTGISVGGDAAWDLALMYPERFAAIVPISGESDPPDAARMKDVPVWAFVGMKDATVEPRETLGMIDAVRAAGGHPHLTAYPDAGHQCWDEAYATDALYTWLFAQKRGQPEVVTPGVPTP